MLEAFRRLRGSEGPGVDAAQTQQASGLQRCPWVLPARQTVRVRPQRCIVRGTATEISQRELCGPLYQ